ncbi:hypothetical protein EZJ19_11315 [Parasulfuritortus cantonensis]|uniref:Uncharacterized protein n=1 Tax=Parasulfuritortus cantonensis TaxID=2528202 RepID=A0A4R1B4G9_9PROT|nr:hypothetical protein [Parasulfuritortus cantonensis]TCJ12821.1 hypothetical protein EZJ19_11315 [Parasulfuritortus cantonensis]
MDPYKFEMKGRAFDGGDRLDKVAGGLMALQHVFDGQFRALTQKKRLYEDDRRYLQVRITGYEDGSFIAYLGAIYAGLQTALPFVHGTPNFWEATKNSFDFLKTLFELAHQGKEVQITQNGDGNTAVIAGDTHQVFNGPVYQIGTQIIGAIREFDDLLEGEEVKRIELQGPDNHTVIQLTSENKGLFFPPTRVDETPVRLTCDIYDFNKYDKIGKARVPNEQLIPAGDYKFRNIGDQAVEDFILSMTEPQVTLSCLIKYQHDPLSDNRIAEILVMAIAA